MSNVMCATEKDKFAAASDQMSRWMDQVLGPSFQHYRHPGGWKPAINLCEYDTHYCVVVDLAGVKAPEIDLRAEKGVMILEGERPMPMAPDATGEARLHLMEIDHGRFSRTIELPEGINVDAIEAFYRNGFLWIRVPKVI